MDHPEIGQPFHEVLGMGNAAGDVIRAAGHGTMAFLGIHVGVKEEGLLSAVGWIVGVGSAAAAIMDLCSISNGSKEDSNV